MSDFYLLILISALLLVLIIEIKNPDYTWAARPTKKRLD
jgi:hypothetical protein